ncbi:MAG TPA: antitoxin VapB family protein [Candidatus Nanoarchaeia archaeon]|nr:antitoxin VapB family protein [Candidatus Nanoarchaeia archaeon]
MATKTITVTTDAYEALRAMKAVRESFSETILRVAKRKPLSTFYGALEPKTGAALEKTITEMRKRRNAAHYQRQKYLRTALKG